MNLRNTYGPIPNSAALATDLNGKNIAAYGCSFHGFQDTFLANQGTQVVSNSYIEGSIDFIWGFSTAYFHQCVIATNTPGGCISAQSRNDIKGHGFVFDHSVITYTSTYGSTLGLSYLGRPYNSNSTAVYLNSFIDANINEAGWSVWSTSSPQTSNVSFFEFNNTGPGSWQADTVRASFARNLTADEAVAFTLNNWIGNTSWLDMNAYNYVPSYSLTAAYRDNGTITTSSSSVSVIPTSTTTLNSTTTAQPSTTSVESGTSSTSQTAGPTSTAPPPNAHPLSGSIPPPGALLVDGSGQIAGAYPSITAALASLPNDTSNQTIFIYPG